MGDMADYTLEQLESHDDYFDSATWNEEDVTFYGPYSRPRFNGKCKWCDTGNLHWLKTPRGWRLANAAGRIHSCGMRKKETE